MRRLFKITWTWQSISVAVVVLLSFFGQFARFDTLFGKVSLHEVVMVPVVVGFLLTGWEHIPSLAKNTLVRFGLIFLIWTAITTYWNAELFQVPELLSGGLAYLVRLALYLAFAVALSLWSKTKTFSARVLLWSCYVWLLLQAIVGLGQFLLFPDTRLLYYLGWDDHLSRAFGTLLDPGFFGLFMVLASILSLHFAVRSRGSKRMVFAGLLAVFVSVLALSYSRASYMAFIGAFLTLSLLWKQRAVLLLIPLLVLAIALLPKDGGGEGQNLLRTRSIQAREEVLQYHAENFSGRELLIGRGWYYESALSLHEKALAEGNGQDSQSAPSWENHAQAVDNVYLHILFSTGIIGTAVFITWLVILLWKLRGHPEILAIWVAVLVHSLTSTALLYSWSVLLLILLSFARKPRLSEANSSRS